MAWILGHHSRSQTEQDGHDALFRYVVTQDINAPLIEQRFGRTPIFVTGLSLLQMLTSTFARHITVIRLTVGEDQFRNRFFEDVSESYGRDRWVEYGDHWQFDSLKITPEWHAWLHHNIDTPPSKESLPEPSYKAAATGNLTGTRDAYVPTHHRLSKKFNGFASEKFEAWHPTQQQLPQQSRERSKLSPNVDVLDLK